MENEVYPTNIDNQPINQPEIIIPNNSSPSKSKLPFIVVGLIFLIFFTVGGVFLGKYFFSPKTTALSTISPKPTIMPTLIPTPNQIVSTTKPASQQSQIFKFKVARDNNFEVTIPQGWVVENKILTREPRDQELGYWTSEQLQELKDQKFTELLNISKDGYIFNMYFPTAFSPSLCIFPGAPTVLPFYDGSLTVDFGTLKDFEKINSPYNNYLRGKTPLLSAGNSFKNMYYVQVCKKEGNNYVSNVGYGLFTYYYPTDKPQTENIQAMDEILKSFH